MVPAPGFALKSKNPGAGKSPPPASPAWWLGAGSIPAWGFKAFTFVTKEKTPDPESKEPSPDPSSSPSWYQSEGDVVPLNKQGRKKIPKSPEPQPSPDESSSKESSPKESSSSQSRKRKNPTPDNSPPLPNKSAPPSSSSSINKEDPDDYLSDYQQAPIGPWDPLKVHNICNLKGEFKLPKKFPRFFPLMSVKGGASLVCNGYVFNCNNQKRAGRSKHYVCEDRSCAAKIHTEGWDKVTSEKESTHAMLQ
ncbi:hypothetical protein DSO57_1020922 [Entomophthora muscae]|uniref:Uncharacterized protein n=1 Tax=Entomophthora muscae TaxID=34485 RepID=A0ACC2SGA8_9FUNG|nr:hypothetical protein DSO57_1020922 [Entomophthora muscae]